MVLDIPVQSRRDTQAAKRLLCKLLKRQCWVPRVMITDKLASYGAAKGEVIPTPSFHRRCRGNLCRLRPPSSPEAQRLNTRAENSHHPPPAFQRRRRWNLRWLRPRDNENGR